jgi:hypothetical protein
MEWGWGKDIFPKYGKIKSPREQVGSLGASGYEGKLN